MASLEERIDLTEQRSAISELIAPFCCTLDLRDVDGLVACFTDEATFRRSHPSFESGEEKLRPYDADNLRVMGSTPYSPQRNLTVEFTGPDAAVSRHYGLAQHAVGDEFVIAAMSYHHECRRVDRKWLISKRAVDFRYCVRAEDLAPYGTRQNLWRRGAPALPTAPSVVADTGIRVMVRTVDFDVPALGDPRRRPDAGDIVTHLCHGGPTGFVGADGGVDPATFAARDRGVLFDVGTRAHFDVGVVRVALEQGLLPDTISSDMPRPPGARVVLRAGDHVALPETGTESRRRSARCGRTGCRDRPGGHARRGLRRWSGRRDLLRGDRCR